MTLQLEDTELTEKTVKEIDTAGSTDGTFSSTKNAPTSSLREKDISTTQRKIHAVIAAELSMDADSLNQTGFQEQSSLVRSSSKGKLLSNGTNKDFNQTSTLRQLPLILLRESNFKLTRETTTRLALIDPPIRPTYQMDTSIFLKSATEQTTATPSQYAQLQELEPQDYLHSFLGNYFKQLMNVILNLSLPLDLMSCTIVDIIA